MVLEGISRPEGYVLFVSGVRGDTRRYRTFHPYEQLNLLGIPVRLSHLTDPRLPELIDRAGVVICHRIPWDPYVQTIVERVSAKGGLVIYDADDLVFDPTAFVWIDSPDFQDSLRARLYQQDMQRYLQMVRASNAALASTEYLAIRLSKLGKPVWVHRNAFSLEMLALSEDAYRSREQNRSRVVLGYASGTPTHNRDFEMIKPALRSVLRCLPGTELWLIGPINPGRDWEGVEQQIRRFPLVAWRNLPGLLAQFDVNLAPLVTDNPFAQSKSEIKWMEAGLVRVPTIASPSQAFQYAIQDRENGFLAEPSLEWEERLSRLATDTSLRHGIGEQVYQDVLNRYHPSVRARELLTSLNEACEGLHDKSLFGGYGATSGEILAENQPLHVIREMEKHPTLSEMAVYTLRHRGAATLLKQMWVYLRRMIAPIVPYHG